MKRASWGTWWVARLAQIKRRMEKLYPLMPRFVRTWAINLRGVAEARVRFSATFYSYLEQAELKHSFSSRQDVGFSGCERHLRAEELAALSAITSQSSCYPVVCSVEDFYSLEIVDRARLQSISASLMRLESSYRLIATSGSTGVALVVPQSRTLVARQNASFWRCRTLNNVELNEPFAQFTARALLAPSCESPPFGQYIYATKQLLLSIYHINPRTVRWYLNEMRRRGVRWLHGYPSTLVHFVNMIQAEGLGAQAKALKLKVVMCGSEQLIEYQRETIGAMFGCPVRQIYSSNEAVASIYECSHGSLHVDEAFSLVEFQAAEHGGYYIIGSQFYNESFNLLRYKTGDLAELRDPEDRCPCGWRTRLVRTILGRELDLIELHNGNRVSLLGLATLSNVLDVQLVQEAVGQVTALVVPGKTFSEEDERRVKAEVANRFENQLSLTIRQVDLIPSGPNGKKPFVVNKLNRAAVGGEKL